MWPFTQFRTPSCNVKEKDHRIRVHRVACGYFENFWCSIHISNIAITWKSQKKKNPKSTFTSYPMRLFKQLDKAFLPFSSLNSDLHRSLSFHNSTINKENPTSTWLLVLLLLLLCTYSCFWSLLFYYWLPLLLPQRNNTAPLPLWKKDCHVHSTNQAALNLNQLSENSLRRSSRKTLAKPLAYCVFISMTALFR